MSDKPDFSEFEDWLVAGSAGSWPDAIEDRQLTSAQSDIVVRNAELLMDREKWHETVNRFETELDKTEHEVQCKQYRQQFHIRFDAFSFVTRKSRHDFSHYRFPCSASFGGATFWPGEVSFQHVIFRGGYLSFGFANFKDGNVLFDNANFGDGEVWFDNSTFGGGEVSFISATFGNGAASFEHTDFGKGDVLFTPKTLEGTSVSFRDATVGENLFVTAHLPEMADFRRLTVGRTASFTECSFNEIPDFRDAKLDRPPEVARMSVPTPKLEGLAQTAVDKEDVGKLRKLKAMAIDASDHEMDGYFFALEMKAKRGTETKGFFPLLFNSLYGWLSDYGQSFLRPIAGLTISWLAFAQLYFIMLNARVAEPLASYFSAEYSFRHVVPLLSSLFRFAPSPLPVGSQPEFQTGFQQRFNDIYAIVLDIDWFTYVSIFQQFVGAVLLFLLLLALRNKFRLK